MSSVNLKEFPKSNPLDGCWAKIERAEYHIKDLTKEIHKFISQLENTSKLDHLHLDQRPAQRDYTLTLTIDPPLILGILAGEILYQLRSSLDHIVYQLLILNGVSGKALEKSEFPICEDSTRYENKGYSKIQNLTPYMLRVIEMIQPYNDLRGCAIKDHPLVVLHSMNNIDKHRIMLTPIVETTSTVVASVTRSGPYGIGINLVNNGVTTFEPSKNRTQLVANVFVPGPIPEPVTVEGIRVECTFDVMFEQIGTRNNMIIPTLINIAGTVRSLVSEFNKKFFS